MERTTSDILLVPMLLVLVGVVIYAVALSGGLRNHILPKYRWASLAFMGIAFIVGAKTLSQLFDSLSPFYRLTLPDRKVLLAHYVAPAVPLLAIGAVFAAEAWFKRYSRSML